MPRFTLGPAISLALAAVLGATACGKSETPAEARPSAASPSSAKAQPAAAVTGADNPLAATGKKPPAQAPSRGPEQAVYSLVDNRLSAHLVRGSGLLIPAGSAGFVKYMRFARTDLSWKIREQRDGKPVAVMTGTTGRIDVPLTAAQLAGSPVLRMRVLNEQDRALSVRVNGHSKQEIGLQMTAGWSTVEASIPGGLLRAGENEILVFTGKGEPMAVEWFYIGGSAPAGEPALGFYDQSSSSLTLPDGGGLAYYVTVPDKGLVAGDIDDGACTVAVTAMTDGGAKVEGELRGAGSAVELGTLAGKAARLELVAKGCASASLRKAALVVPGAAPEVKRAAPPKYVILWIMDSLRADRVEPFFPGARADVPNFDKLARTGATFLQTYVQGNESRASHASIWSALYPAKHRMITGKAKLDTKWTTIDDVLKSAGMYNSGVSGNGYVAKKWGFGESWDVYRNHIHEGGGLKGEDIYAKAVASVEGKKEPWFLYMGTIDTHVSWRPKEPWIWQYHQPGYSGRFSKSFSGEDAGNKSLKLTDAEIEWVRAIYDSNVSYQDELLGQLLAKLEEWGIADETMIVITSDHGDEQWEVGRVGHGGSLRETLIHVPLLIHYPPMLPGGPVAEGAEVVDIVPTVADVLGVKMDSEWQGESLVPLAQGVGRGYPRMSLASQYEGAHAARMGAWKMRVAGSGKAELYNLAEEPGETKDLAETSHIARRMVSDPLWLLRAYNLEWKKSVWGNAANTKAGFPESLGE